MMLAWRPTLWILFRVPNNYRVAGDISHVRPKYWSKRRRDLPTTRHSLGPLQVVQEAKEMVSRSIPFAFAVQRFRFANQQVMSAIGSKARASGIGKQYLPVATWRFAEPGFQHSDLRISQRYTAFLATLSDHSKVSTCTECDAFMRSGKRLPVICPESSAGRRRAAAMAHIRSEFSSSLANLISPRLKETR